MPSDLILRLSGRLHDARGKAIRPFTYVPYSLKPAHQPATPLTPALRRDLGRTRNRFWLWTARIIGVLLFLFGAQMIFLQSWIVYREHGVWNLLQLLAFGIGFTWGGCSLCTQFQGSPRKTRAALLAHRRCVRCAYDLTGANPDPGGITTCPECGAAWRLHDAQKVA